MDNLKPSVIGALSKQTSSKIVPEATLWVPCRFQWVVIHLAEG
jgi:hypothetical protein